MRIGSSAPTRCTSLRLIAERGWELCAPPIPGALRLPDTIGASFAATGRGWRHPTSTGRRPAPGRRARWLEIQGPVSTGSGDAPAMAAESAARLQWLKADAVVTGPLAAALEEELRRLREGPAQSGQPKNGTGHKTPPTRVPKGNPLGRATAPLSVAE